MLGDVHLAAGDANSLAVMALNGDKILTQKLKIYTNYILRCRQFDRVGLNYNASLIDMKNGVGLFLLNNFCQEFQNCVLQIHDVCVLRVQKVNDSRSMFIAIRILGLKMAKLQGNIWNLLKNNK